MKTLVVNTKATRSERPDELTILDDSQKFLSGELPSQDPEEDSFFVVTGDVAKRATSLLASNDRNAYGIKSTSDGVAFYSYPFDDFNPIPRANPEPEETIDLEGNVVMTEIAPAEYQLQVSNASSSHTSSFLIFSDASNAVSDLHGSDGYVLIDENSNYDKSTVVMHSRPSLWDVGENLFGSNSLDKDLSIKNLHRPENDRY